ncbi:MAG: flavin reductase family protein [Hyphomicrobiales bacterium]|nr:flavin reductase family protein [Hyphomicrobiales bacterium]
MFYDVRKKNHGLPHDPFKAIVAPRPIGWISSLAKNGDFNLAPYSFFNAVSDNPHLVMFSSVGWKDSARNARETREFVCNYVGEIHEVQMNETSVPAPSDIDEAEYAGLELVASTLVKPARVKNVWAALECKVTQFLEPVDADGNASGNVMVFGEVVGIHIRDDAIVDGRFELEVTRPVSRGGYLDFGRSGKKFQMLRPEWKK